MIFLLKRIARQTPTIGDWKRLRNKESKIVEPEKETRTNVLGMTSNNTDHSLSKASPISIESRMKWITTVRSV